MLYITEVTKRIFAMPNEKQGSDVTFDYTVDIIIANDKLYSIYIKQCHN